MVETASYFYVKIILQRYPLYISKSSSFSLLQRTPLHIAAGKGYTDTMESLVTKGADVNIKDNAGVSTLALLA